MLAQDSGSRDPGGLTLYGRVLEKLLEGTTYKVGFERRSSTATGQGQTKGQTGGISEF